MDVHEDFRHSKKLLWTTLDKLSCPESFVKIICLFSDDMNGLVFSTGSSSDPLEISKGVRKIAGPSPLQPLIPVTCDRNQTARDSD